MKTNNNISSFGAARTFMQRGTCSESLLAVLNRAYGHPMEREEHASMVLAGGIATHGYQCGMLWGASLAAGAQAYRTFGPTPQAEAAAVFAARRLAETLVQREGSFNCLEITETDWNNKWDMAKFFLKGGTVSCMRRVVSYSKVAHDVIDTALNDFVRRQEPVPAGPVSCAAELARRQGATEIQVVMAAGLAAGIGLSGGGCGALGAALWLAQMDNEEKPTGMSMTTPMIERMLETFLKASGHEFECAEIVGKRFEDPAAHTNHLASGGCAAILDALAGTETSTQAA
jgi:Putative redox-active protein (C_GCAxxG_C_C)